MDTSIWLSWLSSALWESPSSFSATKSLATLARSAAVRLELLIPLIRSTDRETSLCVLTNAHARLMTSLFLHQELQTANSLSQTLTLTQMVPLHFFLVINRPSQRVTNPNSYHSWEPWRKSSTALVCASHLTSSYSVILTRGLHKLSAKTSPFKPCTPTSRSTSASLSLPEAWAL